MLIEQVVKKIRFGNDEMILDPEGGLYWPALHTLIVADLHLEKGSYFAARFQPLPICDTLDTLLRLKKLIKYYQPHKVICLGDNMHDQFSLTRIQDADLLLLQKLCDQVQEWIWIIGNHDKDTSIDVKLPKIQFVTNVKLNNILLTHEFIDENVSQISGHYHPKIMVKINNNIIRGKCFVTTDNKIILPSFGSYTGGLYITNDIFSKKLSTKNFKCFLTHQGKMWRVK